MRGRERFRLRPNFCDSPVRSRSLPQSASSDPTTALIPSAGHHPSRRAAVGQIEGRMVDPIVCLLVTMVVNEAYCATTSGVGAGDPAPVG